MDAPQGNGMLHDKVMLVAGVGPAMGAATARVAAREGAKVALLARRTEISGTTADAIRADGGSALALQCDLGDDSAVRAAVKAVVVEWGHHQAAPPTLGRRQLELQLQNLNFARLQRGEVDVGELGVVGRRVSVLVANV